MAVGTMINILLLALALHMICRRCTRGNAAGLSPGQSRAGGDEESPPLKPPKPAAAVLPAEQVTELAMQSSNPG